MSRILGPSVAGTWYPADGKALGGELDAMLADPAPAPPGSAAAVEGKVIALIAPHAGLTYSGRVAANAFRHVRRSRPSRVMLLGPSHYAAFTGAAAPAADSYRTPLGEVPIDTEAVASLGGHAGWRIDDGPFRPEHCLEMEIPFLQRVLEPGWRLLPVLLGGGSTREQLQTVAAGLEPWFDADTLAVVSSDFTHFGPRFRFTPFETDVQRRIEALDMGAVKRVLAGDADGFASYVDQTAATICGRAGIEVLLRLLPAETSGTLAAYDTSGRMTGDREHSVSYVSVVFSRPGDTGGPS